ncbi:anthranilate synthase component II [Helicobacter sp. 23-1045]
MTLLIDNYDSFAYNLYQLLGGILQQKIRVVRNDELNLGEIEALNPNLIVLSPGPGKPENAGICVDVVREFAGKIPIFGVCLGHQAIALAFGAKVSYAKSIMHGKTSQVAVDTNSRLFAGFAPKISVARYHSLAIAESLPHELKIIAKTADGEIMAIEHKKFALFGVQFHPESILTPQGKAMVENILRAI